MNLARKLDPYITHELDSEVISDIGMPLQRNWWKLCLVGALYVALGLFLFARPFAGTLAINILVGASFLVAGIAHIGQSFQDRAWSGFFLDMLWGTVYFLGGLSLVLFPVSGAVTLTVLLSAFLYFEGTLSIIYALRFKPRRGWGWILFSGLCSALLATLIFFNLPGSGIWALGVLVGVNMLTTGLAMVMLSLAIKAIGRDEFSTSSHL